MGVSMRNNKSRSLLTLRPSRPTGNRSSSRHGASVVQPDELEQARSQAFSKIKSCYISAFVSIAVDVATTMSMSTGIGFNLKASEMLVSAWELGLAFSVYRMSVVYQNIKDVSDELPDVVDAVYRIMAKVWRVTAWMLALEAWLDIRRLYVAKGNMIGLPFLVTSFSLAFFFRRYSHLQVERLFVGDGKDPSSPQSKMYRQMRIIVRNMALCTGGLLLHASTMPLLALARPTLDSKLKGFIKLPTTVITAGLLWKLRGALLETFTAALSKGLKGDLQLKLFNAQKAFYGKVAGTFQLEASLRGIGLVSSLAKSLK